MQKRKARRFKVIGGIGVAISILMISLPLLILAFELEFIPMVAAIVLHALGYIVAHVSLFFILILGDEKVQKVFRNHEASKEILNHFDATHKI